MADKIDKLKNNIDGFKDFYNGLPRTARRDFEGIVNKSSGGSSGSGNEEEKKFNSLGARIKVLGGDLTSGMSETVTELTRFKTGISAISPAIEGTVDGLARITADIPVIGKAFKALADLTPVMVKAMEDSMSAWKSVSQVGGTTAGGLEELRKSASSGYLSLEQYQTAIANNSKTLALFGGTVSEGKESFDAVQNRLTHFDTGLLKLGYSFDEIAEATGSYMALQAKQGQASRMTQDEMAAGTQRYLRELDEMARVTGLSRKELMSHQQQIQAEAKWRAHAIALSEGSAEDKARLKKETKIQEIITARGGEERGLGMRSLLTSGGVPMDEQARQLALAIPGLTAKIQDFQSGKLSDDELLKFVGEGAKTTERRLRGTDKNKGLAQVVGDVQAFGSYASLADLSLLATDQGMPLKPAQEEQKAVEGQKGSLDKAAEIQLKTAQAAADVQDSITAVMPTFVSTAKEAADGLETMTDALKGTVDVLNQIIGFDGKIVESLGGLANKKMAEGEQWGLSKMQEGVPDAKNALNKGKEALGDAADWVGEKWTAVGDAADWVGEKWTNLKEKMMGPSPETVMTPEEEEKSIIARKRMRILRDIMPSAEETQRTVEKMSWHNGKIVGPMAVEGKTYNPDDEGYEEMASGYDQPRTPAEYVIDGKTIKPGDPGYADAEKQGAESAKKIVLQMLDSLESTGDLPKEMQSLPQTAATKLTPTVESGIEEKSIERSLPQTAASRPAIDASVSIMEDAKLAAGIGIEENASVKLETKKTQEELLDGSTEQQKYLKLILEQLQDNGEIESYIYDWALTFQRDLYDAFDIEKKAKENIEKKQQESQGGGGFMGMIHRGLSAAKDAVFGGSNQPQTMSAGPNGAFVKGGGFKENAPELMRRVMKDFGLTKEQAAGLVGNLAHESAGLKAGIQEGGVQKGRGGLGWAQWTGARRRNFEAYLQRTGQQANDPEANYGFLKEELQGSHKSSIDALKRTNNVQDAMMEFERKYEAAGVKHYGSRQKYAEMAYGMNTDSLMPGERGMGNQTIVDIARSKLGQNEANAGGVNGEMTTWLNEKSGTKFQDIRKDTEAWCARFVSATLEEAGIKSGKTASAADYKKWGQGIDANQAQAGDVVMVPREGGSGYHVMISQGIDEATGKLKTIGGNQGGLKQGGGGVTESQYDLATQGMIIRRANEMMSAPSGLSSPMMIDRNNSLALPTGVQGLTTPANANLAAPESSIAKLEAGPVQPTKEEKPTGASASADSGDSSVLASLMSEQISQLSSLNGLMRKQNNTTEKILKTQK